MKVRNRALALLLSVVMVLTFMPALAFADDVTAEENSQPVASEEQAADEDAEAKAAEEAAAKEAAEQAEAEEAAKEAEEQAAKEAAEAKEAEEQAAKEAAEKAAAEQAAIEIEEKAAANSGVQLKASAEEGEAPKAIFDPNGGCIYVWDYDAQVSHEIYEATSFDTSSYIDENENVLYQVPYPSDAFKEGYTFTGWYLENGVKADIENGNYTITSTTTFYAGFEEKDVAVFDANGGTFPDSDDKSVKVVYPDSDGRVWMYSDWEPVKEGPYIFDGWSETKDGPAIEKIDNSYFNYSGHK